MATKSTVKKPKPEVVEEATPKVVPILPGPLTGVQFMTDPKSPFKDGYSIEKEEDFLRDFMAHEPMDESDPLYERYIELEDRKDRIERATRNYSEIKGAESEVTREEARAIDQLGSLVDEETDQMTIHTKEAYRMFMGRRHDPLKKLAPVTGGRRVASALRGLWDLTRYDNPYADWALLRHEQMMDELHKRLDQQIKRAAALLDNLKRQGLNFSILKSAAPQTLELGYRSPYGYAVSRLIVNYDYFVRMQKTLARKTLVTDDEARHSIQIITRATRGAFNEVTRFERWLNKPEVSRLSRRDFLPTADADAKKRVEFASGVFGIVPSEVFTGKFKPRHGQRHTAELTAADRRLLETVGASLDDAQKAEAAAASEPKAAKPEATKPDAGKE